MLEKNSLGLGLILALLLPLVAFGILYGAYGFLESHEWVSSSGFRPMFRERTCAIFAIAINVFLLNYYQKRQLHNTVRGIVIVVSLMVVAWILIFGQYVL